MSRLWSLARHPPELTVRTGSGVCSLQWRSTLNVGGTSLCPRLWSKEKGESELSAGRCGSLPTTWLQRWALVGVDLYLLPDCRDYSTSCWAPTTIHSCNDNGLHPQTEHQIKPSLPRVTFIRYSVTVRKVTNSGCGGTQFRGQPGL